MGANGGLGDVGVNIQATTEIDAPVLAKEWEI